MKLCTSFVAANCSVRRSPFHQEAFGLTPVHKCIDEAITNQIRSIDPRDRDH